MNRWRWIFGCCLMAAWQVLPAAGPAAAAEAGPVLVVLDPGHGGDDGGVRARNSPAEKELMLSLARDVEKHLLQSGALSVALTRSDDQAAALSDRQAAANGGAVAFISLHAAAYQPSLPPVTVFYHSAVTDGRRQDEAARAYGLVSWDLAQNAVHAHSEHLATAILAAWNLAKNRGALLEAPLAVLTGVRCPAVLVEFTLPARGPGLENAAARWQTAGKLAQAIAAFALKGRP